MSRALRSLAPAGGALLAFAAPAQLITGVVQTGGDTDRPAAQQTGQTYTNISAFFTGAPLTVGLFKEDAEIMTDRVHNWNGVLTNIPLPSYLLNQEYIQIANNNRDNAAFRLDITVGGPASIFLLLDNRIGDGVATNAPTLGGATMQWVLDQGWQPAATGQNRFGDPTRPDEAGVDEGSATDGTGRGTGPGNDINNYSSVYFKDVPAGTFSLFQQNAGGLNMYGVVVTPPQIVPEPGALGLLAAGAGLLAWARRRR
jgi:hypothetical protein